VASAVHHRIFSGSNKPIRKISFIGKFEEAVAHYVQKFNVDAVLCGHIYSVSIRLIGNVTYYNCGDWVEPCSAVVEDSNGKIDIVSYLPRAQLTKTLWRSRDLAGSVV
jgi:UDP-2,3-diacylglucosamine pyrophosphatase LpxH